jgi:tetratricopeptide (TPR) repeat protein
MQSAESQVNFDQLWDYNQPAASEARFRQVLATITPDSPVYVELLTQIARSQGLQRNFAEAHQTLDEAERRLKPDNRQAYIRYWLERGRVFNSSKQPDQARPLFLQAWEAALAAGEDFYAVDAAHMLGIISPADEQLAWNLKALELAENSTDPRARQWLGSLYNNIGWTYHDRGQDEQALALFQKAVTWREAAGQSVETRIARWCVARILRALNRVEEALAMQQELRQALEASGESDGYVYEELGECLVTLGNQAEAAPHFARAYHELSKDPWLVENEPARLERLRVQGGIE